MTSTVTWVRRHRLAAFFVLAYVLAWAPLLLFAAGVLPRGLAFFAGAPLVAAVIVIGIADGRTGYRELPSRLLRWREGGSQVVVALGPAPLVVLLAGGVDTGVWGA